MLTASALEKLLRSRSLSERPDNLLWLGQDGNWVRFEACAGSLLGFELAIKDDGGIGEFLSWQAEGAKENLGRPAPGQSHQAHAFFEVAIAGQQRQSFPDEQEKNAFLQSQRIPAGSTLELKDFDAFFEVRKTLLKRELAGLLGVRSSTVTAFCVGGRAPRSLAPVQWPLYQPNIADTKRTTYVITTTKMGMATMRTITQNTILLVFRRGICQVMV